MASTAPAFGRFEIGGVVRRMVSGIGDNWRTLLIVAVATGLVSAAVSGLSMSQLAGAMDPANPTAMLAIFASPVYWVSSFGTLFVTAFSLTAMLAVLLGRDGDVASAGEAFGVALRRFLPMLALTILWVLGLMVGYILIVIPAFIVLTMWSVSAPALVAEGIGPIAAFGRSRALTKGFRWPVFGALVLFGILYIVIAGTIQGGSSLGILSTLRGMQSGEDIRSVSLVGSVFSATLSSVVMSTMTAGFLAGLYGELSEAKEGGSYSQLADVFA